MRPVSNLESNLNLFINIGEGKIFINLVQRRNEIDFSFSKNHAALCNNFN